MKQTIVHEGITYNLLDKSAKVGDLVYVKNEADVDEHNIGQVYKVTDDNGRGLIDTDGFFDDGSALCLKDDEYYVLETSEILEKTSNNVKLDSYHMSVHPDGTNTFEITFKGEPSRDNILAIVNKALGGDI